MIERPENQSDCVPSAISAYVDGELSAHEEIGLEAHVAACPACFDELNLQKSMLLVLSSSFEGEPALELPENFAKTIVAAAETNVSGLRQPRERLTAALICAGLLFFAVFALGSDAGRTLGPLGTGLEKFAAVLSATGHFVFNIALGVVVVFRALSERFIFDSSIAPGLLLAVFVIAAGALSKVVMKGSRV
jgi:anti-sigma factor RsiW